MPAQCCVDGCNKETVKDGVSHHSFPKEEKVRSQWIKAITHTGTHCSRKDWKGPSRDIKSKNSQVVCSDHFDEMCFTLTYRTRKSLGLDVKNYNPKLNKDAVPTKFETEQNPSVMRSVLRKKEIAMILKSNENVCEKNVGSDVLDTAIEPPDSSIIDHDVSIAPEIFAFSNPLSVEEHNTMQSAMTITPLPVGREKQKDANVKKSRTIGTQFLKKHALKTRDCGTQYDLQDIPDSTEQSSNEPLDLRKFPTQNTPVSHWAPNPIKKKKRKVILQRTSTPVKKKKITELSFLSTPTATPDQTILDDSLYVPSEASSDEESLLQERCLIEQRKFIVYEDTLLGLFTVCRSRSRAQLQV